MENETSAIALKARGLTKKFTPAAALPAVGWAIASAIAEMAATGRWSPQLQRLRGELTPKALFPTIPGIGERLAHTLARTAAREPRRSRTCDPFWQ
ncbi:hypothetical protein I6F26_30455 [Ensifer sp. IC3342]|nr:hypothetical protein [Ensifer sp. BRP08]MCA1450830.1 hypothetical protein [Ensifer sp. IC3342]